MIQRFSIQVLRRDIARNVDGFIFLQRDIDKASFTDQIEISLLLNRTGYATRIHFCRVLQPLWQCALQYDIGDTEVCAGFHHAVHFVEDTCFVGHEVEYAIADDDISGVGADPDHDGVPNRTEWWLLGSAVESDGGPWCSWQLAGGAVALTYDRRAGFPTAMTLETSTNLENWQPAAGVSQLLPLDASGLGERVSWSIPTTEPRLFLRLK